MPVSSAANVKIAVSPSLAGWRSSLAASLGSGFEVVCEPSHESAVVVVGSIEAGEVDVLRRALPGLGIVVLFDQAHEPSRVDVVEILDSGADACITTQNALVVAAHVRAIARRRAPDVAGSSILDPSLYR